MVLETLVSVKLLTNEEQDGARHCPHDQQVDRLFAQQQTCSLWKQYHIICIVFVVDCICICVCICIAFVLHYLPNSGLPHYGNCIVLQWTRMNCIVSWQCYNMQFTSMYQCSALRCIISKSAIMHSVH